MSNVVFRFDTFRLDPVKRELERDGERVDVPARVFACLVYLIEHRERAVGRAELIEAAWHRDNVSDTQLFQLILRARRLVGDEAEHQHSIRTIPAFGYRWVAPTELEGEDDVPSDVVHVPEPAPRGSVTTPGSRPPSELATGSRRWRPGWLSALAVAAVLALGAVAYLRSDKPAPHPLAPAGDDIARIHVAVLPLRIGETPDAAWVRLGGMDLIADRLRRAGLAVQPSEATLGVMSAAKSAPEGWMGRLRQSAGINLIVDGEVEHERSAWNVDLHANADGVRELHVSASDADLMVALQGASSRLLLALGRSAPVDTTSTALSERLQRARAALLADDPERAGKLLEEAPAPMRGDGELRLLHAQVEERRGHFELAESELTELLGESHVGEDAVYLRMRALIMRGGVRMRLDHGTEAAKKDFDAALAEPGASAFVHALGSAYVGRGATEMARNEHAAAASDLGRARVLLSQSGDMLAVARVDLQLALLDAARGASAEADARYTQAARQFEAFGAIRSLKSALIGLQDLQFDHLQNRAALATSNRAWAIAMNGGDPLLKRIMALMRARILLAHGHLRELHGLIAEIERGDLSYLSASRDELRLLLLRVELAVREGRTADAASLAADLPSGLMPGGRDDVLQARAALWRHRVLPPASSSDVIAPSLLLDAGSRAAIPNRRLAEAEFAWRLGQKDEAERAYREALMSTEQTGTPLEMANVIESYAAALIRQGRLADAAALAGRIGAWADDDFDCALLQLRLAHALGEWNAWKTALANARRLAGEREIPAELSNVPVLGSTG